MHTVPVGRPLHSKGTCTSACMRVNVSMHTCSLCNDIYVMICAAAGLYQLHRTHKSMVVNTQLQQGYKAQAASCLLEAFVMQAEAQDESRALPAWIQEIQGNNNLITCNNQHKLAS
eukprot:1161923-Pelagomonas_calceolata.AAC.17